jgi:hypothetical protein
MPLNVLTFGASRNIGYFAAIRLLGELHLTLYSLCRPLIYLFLAEKGATVTFLLRSTAIFDEDLVIQGYVKAGTARLVKGDALNEADTRRAWAEAGVVDVVIFSVGKFSPHVYCCKC